ncbi:hypothetical protein Sps_03862 [Shewanella psychrophila]|uniref:Uncharacterized protein n=1 Tax=Shewanella psychrophila TaxID=225848 RepID=A0A1S6HTT4_9GAMM|nr:hypothetical protein [Shewanella psychrophila]AQS38977.1 hypothetical protein Sps_03862 [Shewanella psychrophila]
MKNEGISKGKIINYHCYLRQNPHYKPSYAITLEELEWLGERVAYLQALTERLCKAKIASYLE